MDPEIIEELREVLFALEEVNGVPTEPPEVEHSPSAWTTGSSLGIDLDNALIGLLDESQTFSTPVEVDEEMVRRIVEH